MPLNNSNISAINNRIVEEIKRELRLQGHYLTGALEGSINGKVTGKKNETELTASAFQYIEPLEEGIERQHIDSSDTAINAMAGYVKLRMGENDPVKARQIAYLIIEKQLKEGMPTKNSYQYSQTGDRTDAIAETFRKYEEGYFNAIDIEVENFVDESFDNLQSGTI